MCVPHAKPRSLKLAKQLEAAEKEAAEQTSARLEPAGRAEDVDPETRALIEKLQREEEEAEERRKQQRLQQEQIDAKMAHDLQSRDAPQPTPRCVGVQRRTFPSGKLPTGRRR